MAEPAKSQIEGLIGEISIAAVRSWLKSKGLTHSAGSREALIQRVEKLILQSLAWTWWRVGFVVFLAALTVSAGQAPSLAESKNKLKEPSMDELRKDLEAAARKLLTILETGEETRLVDTISPQGIVIGHEPPSINIQNIRKQFENKKGVYCVLFDTDCLRKEWAKYWGEHGPPENLYSYREMLQRSSSRKVKIFVSRSSDADSRVVWFGHLTVFLKEDSKGATFWFGDPLDFSFRYESGCWKLTAVTYP